MVVISDTEWQLKHDEYQRFLLEFEKLGDDRARRKLKDAHEDGVYIFPTTFNGVDVSSDIIEGDNEGLYTPGELKRFQEAQVTRKPIPRFQNRYTPHGELGLTDVPRVDWNDAENMFSAEDDRVLRCLNDEDEDADKKLQFVRHKKKTITLTRDDFGSLARTEWLNDHIINSYFSILVTQYTNCWVHSTFFYTKYKVKGYNDVQRWVKKSKCPKGLHNYDLVVIPIHLGIHWACGFIDFKRKTIEYYDSMGGSEIAFYSVMLAYLEDYYDDTAAWTNGFVFKKDEWAGVRNVERDIQDLELNDVTPQQDDGYSCGVFALKFAEYRMMNCRFCFTYKDIANFRLQMALALWNTGEQVEEGISAVDNA